VCCDYERLPRGRLLDQLKHADQGNVIAAELVTGRCHAEVRSVTRFVHCSSRLLRNRRYAIPAACIRDTDEQRKHPQPKNAGGQEFAMAMEQTRHDFFDITGSNCFQHAGVI